MRPRVTTWAVMLEVALIDAPPELREVNFNPVDLSEAVHLGWVAEDLVQWGTGWALAADHRARGDRDWVLDQPEWVKLPLWSAARIRLNADPALGDWRRGVLFHLGCLQVVPRSSAEG